MPPQLAAFILGPRSIEYKHPSMVQLLEHNKKICAAKDIVGELEQYIVDIADDGDQLIARGC